MAKQPKEIIRHGALPVHIEDMVHRNTAMCQVAVPRIRFAEKPPLDATCQICIGMWNKREGRKK